MTLLEKKHRFADRGAAGAASLDQRSLMFNQTVLQKRALWRTCKNYK